jgi:hypothetical protein
MSVKAGQAQIHFDRRGTGLSDPVPLDQLWLGRDPRFRTLREALERTPIDVVFAVDWLEHPDRAEQRQLRSDFVDRLREAAGARTVVVLSADGTLRAYPFAS